MSTRRLSNIENQPEILRFVGKERTKLEKQQKEVTSTTSASSQSLERSSQKKHARGDLSSPEKSAERQPAKKATMSTITPVPDNND